MFKKLARMMSVGAVLFQAGTCTQQDLAILASALDEIVTLADEFDSFDGDPFGFDEDPFDFDDRPFRPRNGSQR